MSASNAKAIEAGHAAAESPSVKLWGVFGFFLPLIGLLVAHLRTPTIPASLVAAYDDENTRYLYQSGFSERLKGRQVRAAWIGFGVAFICALLAGMAMCALTVVGLSELSGDSTFGDVIQGAETASSSGWYSLDRPGCVDCSGKGPAARAWAEAYTGPSSAAAPGPGAPKPTPSPASGNLTAAQRNAVRSANTYLQLSGFSRQGLIDQLSSEFGDSYSVGDATVAVNSKSTDWNAQAARSAVLYLELSGFSCQGLIDQLSSEFGEKYTVEQATYGATQAGIC